MRHDPSHVGRAVTFRLPRLTLTISAKAETSITPVSLPCPLKLSFSISQSKLLVGKDQPHRIDTFLSRPHLLLDRRAEGNKYTTHHHLFNTY